MWSTRPTTINMCSCLGELFSSVTMTLAVRIREESCELIHTSRSTAILMVVIVAVRCMREVHVGRICEERAHCE